MSARECNFLVDSRNRQQISWSENASQFTLAVPSSWETSHEVSSIEVHSVIYVNSVYNIKTGTVFAINQDDTVKVVSVPAGFYTYNSLVTALTAEGGCAEGWTFTMGNDGRVTIDASTGTNSNTSKWSFYSRTIVTDMLGFTTDTVYQPVIIPAVSQKGSYIVNMIRDPYMHICLDSIEGVMSTGTKPGNDSGSALSKVIATLPLTSVWSSVNNYLPPVHEYRLPDSQKFDLLKFSVRDYLGNILSLNGTEWSMRLHVNFR